jgi:hypothetical protein
MTGIPKPKRPNNWGEEVTGPTGGTGDSPSGNTGGGAAFPGLFSPQNPLASYQKPVPGAFPVMPRLSHEPLGLLPPEQPTMGLGNYASPGMSGMPIFNPNGNQGAPPPGPGFTGFGNDLFFRPGDPRSTTQPNQSSYYVKPPVSGPTTPAAKPFEGMGDDYRLPTQMRTLRPNADPRYAKQDWANQDPATANRAKGDSYQPPGSGLFWEPKGGQSSGQSGQQGYSPRMPQISSSAPAGRVNNFPTGNSPLTPPSGNRSNAGGYAHMPFGSGQDANRAIFGGPTIFDPGGNSIHNYGTPDAAFTYEQQQRMMADQLGNRFNQNSRSGANAGASSMPVYGGGGGGGFADALDAANQANLDRYNEILGGYTAGRKRTDELLNQLGGKKEREAVEEHRRNQGNITQRMIDRGLTNSSVTTSFLGRNDENLAENRRDIMEDLADRRLRTEYDQLKDTLGFMERRNDQAPNLDRMARLMQDAAAGGMGGQGGGQGGFAAVDMSGYANPGMGGFFGGGYMGPMGGANIQPRGGRRGGGGGGGPMDVEAQAEANYREFINNAQRNRGFGGDLDFGTGPSSAPLNWVDGSGGDGTMLAGMGSGSGATGTMGGAGSTRNALSPYFNSAMQGLASAMGRGADVFGDTVSGYLSPNRLNAPGFSHSSWMADIPGLQALLYR